LHPVTGCFVRVSLPSGGGVRAVLKVAPLYFRIVPATGHRFVDSFLFVLSVRALDVQLTRVRRIVASFGRRVRGTRVS